MHTDQGDYMFEEGAWEITELSYLIFLWKIGECFEWVVASKCPKRRKKE
jgi:hypothetical protein